MSLFSDCKYTYVYIVYIYTFFSFLGAIFCLSNYFLFDNKGCESRGYGLYMDDADIDNMYTANRTAQNRLFSTYL